MPSQRWRESATCTIGSDGTGTAALTLRGAGLYEVRFASVSTSVTGTKSSVAKLYRDSVAPINFVEGTKSGDADSTNSTFDLVTPETLICQWTGAVPGASALLRVEGRFTAEG